MAQLSQTAQTDAQIFGLMADHHEWTIAALASTLAMSPETVRRAILRLIGKRKVYHSRTLLMSRTYIYRIVKSEIAARQDSAAFGSEHKARRVGCRSRDIDHWPVADQVLASAVHAMVRTGNPSTGRARKISEKH